MNNISLVDFYAERGICVGNKFFKHSNLHKYIRVARGQDGAEVMNMIDLVLVKKAMLRYVHNMRGSERYGIKPFRSSHTA